MKNEESRDPVRHIPSPGVLKKQIKELQERARKLGILLRTADEIQQERGGESHPGSRSDAT
jgi:hypothetical protein